MPEPVLFLEADSYRDDQHWYWHLKDARGNFLADHEVQLNPNDWQHDAIRDLYGYLRSHAAPDKRHEQESALVDQVGAWVGRHVLGPVAD